MEQDIDHISENTRQKYKLINQQYMIYVLLLLILLGVIIYILWHTVNIGRQGEGVALGIIFGMGYFSAVWIFIGRWLDARQKVRLQNTMNNLAQTAPTRRLDEVTPTEQHKASLSEIKTPPTGTPK